MFFTILGGDDRQLALAKYLAVDGHRVGLFAMDKADIPPADRLTAPMCGDVTVLPLPVSFDGASLTAPYARRGIHMDEVIGAIRPGALVFGGKIMPKHRAEMEKRGARVYDYFEREEFTVANAGATAEAAVAMLMSERRRVIAGTRILVVGFGRIGKLLALKLRALGADVTVSSRRAEQRTFIEALGMTPADTASFADLGKFDAVVNTAPAPVITAEHIAALRRGCFVLDLASAPGGVDFDAAEKCGIEARLAPGLPGKMFPESAGGFIRDTIYNIINETECTS